MPSCKSGVDCWAAAPDPLSESQFPNAGKRPRHPPRMPAPPPWALVRKLLGPRLNIPAAATNGCRRHRRAAGDDDLDGDLVRAACAQTMRLAKTSADGPPQRRSSDRSGRHRRRQKRPAPPRLRERARSRRGTWRPPSHQPARDAPRTKQKPRCAREDMRLPQALQTDPNDRAECRQLYQGAQQSLHVSHYAPEPSPAPPI